MRIVVPVQNQLGRNGASRAPVVLWERDRKERASPMKTVRRRVVQYRTRFRSTCTVLTDLVVGTVQYLVGVLYPEYGDTRDCEINVA